MQQPAVLSRVISIDKKMKKVNRQQEDQAGINCLNIDLLERILSILPLKPRTRLKCVSKNWCTAITNLRPSLTSSSSGLVIFSFEENFRAGRLPFYPLTFLAAHDDGTCTEVKSFELRRFPFSTLLTDSQNGLLLLRYSFSPCIYLCNPLRLSDDPAAAITELPFLDCLGHSQCGFFFDPSSSNHQYKVLLFSMNSDCYDEGKVSCQIFSSESEEWEEHEATLLKPSSSRHGLSLSYGDSSEFAPCLCHDRKLHWLFRKILMVDDFDEEFFQVVNLPSNLTTRDIKLNRFYYHHGILWESEGYLYYFQSAKGGLSVWIYDQYGEDGDDDEGGHNWIFKRWIPLKMSEEEKDLYYAIREDDDICPVVFNEELQILYLHNQHATLYSYSFETQRLSRAWSHYDKDSRAKIQMCYSFPIDIFS